MLDATIRVIQLIKLMQISSSFLFFFLFSMQSFPVFNSIQLINLCLCYRDVSPIQTQRPNWSALKSWDAEMYQTVLDTIPGCNRCIRWNQEGEMYQIQFQQIVTCIRLCQCFFFSNFYPWVSITESILYRLQFYMVPVHQDIELKTTGSFYTTLS